MAQFPSESTRREEEGKKIRREKGVKENFLLSEEVAHFTGCLRRREEGGFKTFFSFPDLNLSAGEKKESLAAAAPALYLPDFENFYPPKKNDLARERKKHPSLCVSCIFTEYFFNVCVFGKKSFQLGKNSIKSRWRMMDKKRSLVHSKKEAAKINTPSLFYRGCAQRSTSASCGL